MQGRKRPCAVVSGSREVRGDGLAGKDAGWDASDFVAGTLLALGLNSLYLAARADASLFYFANVAAHLALGVAAAALVGSRVRRNWPGLDALWRAAAVLFSLGSGLGLALMVTGATRPFRPLLYAHIACVVDGGAGSRSWRGCAAARRCPRAPRARRRPRRRCSRSRRPPHGPSPTCARRST